jgi:hypothetical protein
MTTQAPEIQWEGIKILAPEPSWATMGSLVSYSPFETLGANEPPALQMQVLYVIINPAAPAF